MNLTKISARIQLLASATPTAFATGETRTLGYDSGAIHSYTTDRTLFSREITADDAADVATLDLSDGSVAQTTGSPVTSFPSSGDFEAAAIDCEAVERLVIEADSENTSAIAVACSSDNLPDIPALLPGAIVSFMIDPDHDQADDGTLAATFGTAGDIIRIHVLAYDAAGGA